MIFVIIILIWIILGIIVTSDFYLSSIMKIEEIHQHIGVVIVFFIFAPLLITIIIYSKITNKGDLYDTTENNRK